MSRWGLLLTGISSVIGSGWLFASLYAAERAGPAAILSWVIGSLMALAIALVFAELGAMMPVSGGLAKIPHYSHGTTVSYVAGLLSWLGYVTLPSIEVMAILEYLQGQFPSLVQTVGDDKMLTSQGLLVAAILLAAVVWINLRGARAMETSNTIVTVWKLAVPAIAAGSLILAGFHSENFTEHGGLFPLGIDGMMAAVSTGGVIFSILGFRTVIEMAGEVENPQRNVPFALIGTVIVCGAIYVLLQVAFIGALQADDLSNGWQGLGAAFSGGPFGVLAAALGLGWLSKMLYVDAILSPGGTTLVYVGATARLNYAMAQNGNAPRAFARLNRRGVPAVAILVNYVFGLLLMAPFPGWHQMVGFISSAVVLSTGFGPVSLLVLRRAAPSAERPYRLPFALPFSAMTFVFSTYIVYWSGWETVWKLMAAIAIGMTIYPVILTNTAEWGRVQWRRSWWVWLYFGLLTGFSYIGRYGGHDLIPNYVDLVLLAALSLAIFTLAVRQCLPAAEVRAALETDGAKLH